MSGSQHGALCHLFHARGTRPVAAPMSGDLEDTRIVALTRSDLEDAVRGGAFAVITDAAAVALAMMWPSA